jgi:hypothetical protein
LKKIDKDEDKEQIKFLLPMTEILRILYIEKVYCEWRSPMEISTDTTEGKNKPDIVGRADICPLIHSMVVVTSPVMYDMMGRVMVREGRDEN